MDLGAILIAVFVSVGVKLVVMGLAARLLLRTYRASYLLSAPKPWRLLSAAEGQQHTLLWLSLVLFFVAELTCGVEAWILLRSHWLLTGTHALVSGLGASLFALAMVRLLAERGLRFGQPGCASQPICGGCTVTSQAGCKLRVWMLLLASGVGLAALPSLLVDTAPMVAHTRGYLVPIPGVEVWFHQVVEPWLRAHVASYDPTDDPYLLPHSMMVIEFRLLPLAGLGLALASVLATRAGKAVAGFELLACAVGLLSYVYLEAALYPLSGDVLLGSLGHELAELVFLLLTGEGLRLLLGPLRAS